MWGREKSLTREEHGGTPYRRGRQRFPPWTSVSPVVKAFDFAHSRTAGSATTAPGTHAFRNSSDHCGRTLNSPSVAGTTTPSPFANVTGSRPAPRPRPATVNGHQDLYRVFPGFITCRKIVGAFNSKSPPEIRRGDQADRRLAPPSIATGAGRITFPEAT
jgi:hypothetical protein